MTDKLTAQGVRDLNQMGGKRTNGKRRACPHFSDAIYIVGKKEFRDERGPFWVNVLACEDCEEVLGPETEVEERIK